jgi:hypothetical protein
LLSLRVRPLRRRLPRGPGDVGHVLEDGDGFETGPTDAAAEEDSETGPTDAAQQKDSAFSPDGTPTVYTATLSKPTATSPPVAWRSTGTALQSLATSERIWIFGGYSGLAVGFSNDLFDYVYDPVGQTWAAVASCLPLTAKNRSDGGSVHSPALGGLFWFGGRTAMTGYGNESWLLTLK